MKDKFRRTIFATLRSSEYFEEGSLRALIGYGKSRWVPALIKELVDNSIDAGESSGIPPEIAVTVNINSFTVSDNGPGISRETIEKSLDYDYRISDKKWYISPSRGQLGSALKTLWPAYYVATWKAGKVEVFTRGYHHTIVASGGKIKSHDWEQDSTVKIGTSITAHWPRIACLLTNAEDSESYREPYAGRMDAVVVDIVRDFAAVNPHATFTVTAGGKTSTFSATNPKWKKWRVSDGGSPHWYSATDTVNLLTAYHHHEEQLAKSGVQQRRLTLRDVIASFNGLRGTQTRSRVLEEAKLSGMSLAEVFEHDDAYIAGVSERLLEACCNHSRVPKPRALGIIGKPHLAKTMAAYGADKDIEYKAIAAFDEANLPYVVEIAFGVRKQRERKMVFALNNSVVFQTPAEHISDTLSDCDVDEDDPVVLLVHATCPKFAFTTQGKNALAMSSAMQNSIHDLLVKVTAKFTKAKRSEAARRNREAITDEDIEKLREKKRVQSEDQQIKAACFKFMAEAYRQAAGVHNTADNRQIFYQCRPLVRNATGKGIDFGYFGKVLIDYMEQHEEECASWHVEYDPRGHFREPHGGTFFGIGTVETRHYIESWTDGNDGADIGSLNIASKFPTSGPRNRFSACVYIEKEGFDDLIIRSRIAERYDVAFFSCKGQSVTAARRLVDELSQVGVTVFIVHDFDRSGMSIAYCIGHDSRRHEFEVPPSVVDLGLRLKDVWRMKLESESCEYVQDKNPADILREKYEGITEEEIKFLVPGDGEWDPHSEKYVWNGNRVELNAMTSEQFVSFLERKLEEHGVKKVVPDKATLQMAWERAEKIRLLNAAIDEAMKRVNQKGATRTAPRDLATQIREKLRRNPLLSWDEALARIAAK